jgi:primosomal protein N' (replication factor Y)
MNSPAGPVVRVVPDVGAIGREFDYYVPPAMVDRVQVGTMVRVSLAGRRVGAWVVATDVEPPAGVELAPLAKVRGHGPDAATLDLARWASRRWVGPLARFLRTASPDRAVTRLGPTKPSRTDALGDSMGDALGDTFEPGTHLWRIAPGSDRWPLIADAVRLGDALIVTPDLRSAASLVRRLRKAGVWVADGFDQWGRAASGATVVGGRRAIWAPMPNLRSIVVLDEHDERLQEQTSPTWHVREVAMERAARANVPCVLVSPMPTLEAQAATPTARRSAQARSVERNGWPQVEVVDLRTVDTVRSGLYPPALIRNLRGDHRVVAIVNRRGRARLLVCGACDTTATCDTCESAVMLTEEKRLRCRRCDHERPMVCRACGSTRMKSLRVGVTRIAEELEALMREPVVEVTTDTGGAPLAQARLYVGTEAALHQVERPDVVAFLDFDQELLAPRYRAAEQALGLLALAGRSVGGRGGATRGRPGRVVVQTRLADHEVLQAAVRGEPMLVSEAEQQRRSMLGFPPARAMAAVSGAVAPEFMDGFTAPLGVEVLGPRDGQWLVRAEDHHTLTDALLQTPRPSGRMRIEVDPLRV